MVENFWAVGAPPETPLGELTALPETTLADGEGVAAPYPRTPPPLSAFVPSVLPPMKNPGHAP